jgi:hypothetical protein
MFKHEKQDDGRITDFADMVMRASRVEWLQFDRM